MRSAQALALSLVISAAASQQQYRPGSGFGGASAGFGASEGFNDDLGGGAGGEETGGSLEETIPGVPGDDYPIFAEVPETSFVCDGLVEGGYYADPEAECQAFHICGNDGNGGLTKYSFLCPNGTLFNQQYFVCDWWFNVDCSLAEEFWSLNDQVAAERAANSPPGTAPGDEAPAGPQAGAGGARAGGRQSGGRRGAQAAASSLRGSYSAPDSGSADSGYGAPADYDSGSAPLAGYGSRRSSRRRNARELTDLSLAGQDPLEFEY